MSQTKNYLIDKLNNLPQYSAEETGTPCLAFDDVMEVMQYDKILLAEECGLTFTGYEKGEAQFIGDDKAWDNFNKGGI